LIAVSFASELEDWNNTFDIAGRAIKPSVL
jgi:hypothetical protein